MDNRFYSSFDDETPGTRKRDYRTPFQIDRDRLIYSHAFRKLQSKTQVFLSGEYDFYRTRLTHSIEVAQVGRSICAFLRGAPGPLGDDFFIDPDLVEAVCLAHDLGHPPFGHAGERTLHTLMVPYGGFEGNAQTLRLLTETLYQAETDIRGMQPTRALLDGVLKYKALFSEFAKPPEHHFLYDEQAIWRDFAFGSDGVPPDLRQPKDLNGFKSIECQIMDWADDVAYSLNDVVDGVKVGFLTLERIERWAAEAKLAPGEAVEVEGLARAIREDRLESIFSLKIGRFIQGCTLVERQGPLSGVTNRYKFGLSVEPSCCAEAEFFKKLAGDLLYQSPQLQQLEHKGRVVLSRLFETFWEEYGSGKERRIGILPARVARLIDGEPSSCGKARRICDHLAGMTDTLAVRTYRRLFDPEFGSIRDLS